MLEEIVAPLLAWYGENKRTLPWREDRNPYHIWLSEVMLQQTRVEAVKGYYERFLDRLPEVGDLAAVPEDELMKLWQGLGYYSRARNLKRAAAMIMDDYGGVFPEEYEEILRLPGIGAYTAGAVASMAFGKAVPAVDGNVYRVYTRLVRESGDITRGRVQKAIREEIGKIMPPEAPGEFNQAWMDLGAGVCIPVGDPLCGKCPLAEQCEARRAGDAILYPNKPKKKPRKREEKTVFILEYQGKYVLQKRPEQGLLAGLWEFPTQEGHLSLEEAGMLLREWGTWGEEVELLGSGKHIFTHIEWHMLGYLVHLKQLPWKETENLVLASREEIRRDFSIPSAYGVYLEQLMS